MVSTATSFGQGSVYFANWVQSDQLYEAPISYDPALAPAGKAGQRVGSQFVAQLLYAIGGNPFAVAAGSRTAFTGTDGDNPGFAGFFFGDAVVIPQYTTGPISFKVQAFNGADFDTSPVRGESAAFTLASIATGTTPVGDLFNGGVGGLQGFSVALVPEPSVLALIGLGSTGLLLFRRRS